MTVAFDQNGYAYDVSTGLYVNLYYDENGAAYDQATGERIDEVIVDSVGTTVYTSGGGINWNDVIRTAAQAYAAGEGAAQSGRYIPVQGSQSPYGYQTLSGGGGATITGGITPGGVRGGLNISTNTLMLIAGGVLLFILGSQRRGR